MKFVVNRLRKGDVVSAEIVEAVSHDEYIVNFDGDLIRVANQSERSMKVGHSIQLKVVSVEPLGFQLVTRSAGTYSTTA